MYWYVCKFVCQPNDFGNLTKTLELVIPDLILGKVSEKPNDTTYTYKYVFIVCTSRQLESEQCAELSKILIRDNAILHATFYPYICNDANLAEYRSEISIVQERIRNDVRNKMCEERADFTETFIRNNLSINPSADAKVLHFIADILYHGVPEVKLDVSCESIRSTFRAGYCYYFAVMLKEAFNRGQVCQAYPFGHIVWLDDDNTPYDVEGINVSECSRYIPISYLGDGIKDFKHVPGESFDIYTGYLEDVLEKYLKDKHE